MCKFKSGIILKTKSVVAQGSNDSHTDLLKELNIDDTTQNAMTKFVRAELIPPNDEWWTNPDTWEINIDQDITPDWFSNDKEKYIAEFREAVKTWWKAHVLVDKEIEELSTGYYRLKGCEIKRLTKDVQVMCSDSVIQEMSDNSIIQTMRGSSSVQEMHNSSTVLEMNDSSTVQVMNNNSWVQVMYDSSSVQVMCDSSSAHVMCDSSSVQKMYGRSSVEVMYGRSSVQEMYDSSIVQEMYGSSSVQEMYGRSSVQEMYGSSIARDYKNNIIHTSSESNLKPVIHENE